MSIPTLSTVLLSICTRHLMCPCRHRAFIRFPEGKYSDLELKAILRKYRHLPGISGVRMDKLDIVRKYQPPETNKTLALPPRRSLMSWMRLSNVRNNQVRKKPIFLAIMLVVYTSILLTNFQIVVDKGDAENDQSETHHLFRHHRHKWETSSCINET